jgi:hypothetical protein
MRRDRMRSQDTIDCCLEAQGAAPTGRCGATAVRLAVLMRVSATSGAEERVPTGGELTRFSGCRPWLA